MEVAILVPLIFFTSIVLIVALPFYFKHRNRRLVFEAIKATIEKTGEVDPSLIEAITAENVGPNADIRRGLLLVAFAIGLFLLGLFVPEPEAARVLMGLAFLPGLIGIAYTAFHFFLPREVTV